MNVYTLLDQSIPDIHKHAVVAIGNFDGAHIGHQMLFELARRRAKELDAPFVILTFTPHPKLFFRPDSAPFLITPLPTKLERLKKSLADACIIVPFNAHLAHKTADEFVRTILVEYLAAQHVFVGDDFRFGHNRTGSPDTIRTHGINVTAVHPFTDHTGAPYSSTRIRAALQEGNIAQANHLLGWSFDIRGEVIHGDKRGRTLGFPTANTLLGETIAPAHGIYAAWIKIEGGEHSIPYRAAISLGMRPMFEVSYPLLEAHLLDFNGDLYGKTLSVQLVRHLRDEQHFASIGDLIAQMHRDCDAARTVLVPPQ